MTENKTIPANAIFTIGHSTRPVEEFIAMLQHFKIHTLVDVRTMPRSRANPHYNADALAQSLQHEAIGYTHMKSLGGLRKPLTHSINTGWENESFRGYADYMQTLEFAAALGELRALAARQRICIMCAEAVPWKCHRSLIADALTAQYVPVWHIMSAGAADQHHLTEFAKVSDGHITYPPPIDLLTDIPPRSVPGTTTTG